MVAIISELELKKKYDRDFNQWLEITANLLKEKKFTELDLANLIIEIEAMGKSNQRELKNRLVVLIMHLLKWKYQPKKRTNSWVKTINEQRRQLLFLLEDNPSLNHKIEDIINQYYYLARKEASQETKLNLAIFPQDNPFTLSQVFDSDFFPES
ncbi:DUF29 domain-containing protein [Geminocystis sp. CENA526]|uniref:DUF29 domain-containing protein n=1 Tax=Geminocystis sp. CENA526 TaxID=1355871 RepID=UPI003D6DD32C